VAMLEVLWLCTMDRRNERLAELRRQLAELNARGRQTAPGSPERDAVLALAEELEGEE